MPGVFGDPGKEARKQADEDRAREAARQQAIRDGTSRIDDIFGKNFNDDFYNKRQSAFLDYADPQLEDQYADARKKLTFSLARDGTLDSSIRAEKEGALQKLYDTNKQQIGDQALSYKNDAKNKVEESRSGLITTLNATGDAEAAANGALTRSQALSAPQAFSPLSQLFSNFTSTLGTQAAQERAEAQSMVNGQPTYVSKYNIGLYPRNSDTVVVK